MTELGNAGLTETEVGTVVRYIANHFDVKPERVWYHGLSHSHSIWRVLCKHGNSSFGMGKVPSPQRELLMLEPILQTVSTLDRLGVTILAGQCSECGGVYFVQAP